MSRGTLYLDVEVYGGSNIFDTCVDAIELATRIGISIWFNFNSVRCLARPEDDPEKLAAEWERALHSDSSYKFASTR